MTDDCFQLKGSVITTFILEFNDFDARVFAQQLKTKVNASPDFFQDSTVIIDFSKLDLNALDINYQQIITICRDNGMQAIAFRQNNDLDLSAVKDTKLAVIDHNTAKPDKNKTQKLAEPVLYKESKIISKPIRSGQQIYAEGSDLIILGSVSGGAEVLADGNIHIYGTLRGRALAGVKGNTNARIFCNNNEAELVSINGHFLINDSLESLAWKQAAHFYLIDETLHVEAL